MSQRIDWDEVKRKLAESERLLESSCRWDAGAIEEIFARRAEEFLHRGRSRESEDVITILEFIIGSMAYGIELQHVEEVVGCDRWTPVPGSIPELLGVVNLRGEVRSVLDLPAILGGDGSDRSEEGHVMLLRVGTHSVGVWVDRVERIRSVSRDSLVAPGASCSSSFVQAMSESGTFVLDTGSFLNSTLGLIGDSQ